VAAAHRPAAGPGAGTHAGAAAGGGREGGVAKHTVHAHNNSTRHCLAYCMFLDVGNVLGMALLLLSQLLQQILFSVSSPGTTDAN